MHVKYYRIDNKRIDYNELTNNKMKIVLKQLKLYKFLDQSTFFLVLFRKKSIIFTDDLNNRILDVFIKLEKPFAILYYLF